VVVMANQSGGSFKEPAAKPAAQKPAAEQTASAAPVKPAAADGKAVYDKACVACHATGIANAPKLGDKAAWAPRVAQGMDAMLQSVIKGKGAMPPKAGNPALSDAELRASVEFMVSQSK
jgi:cytochrome c5